MNRLYSLATMFNRTRLTAGLTPSHWGGSTRRYVSQTRPSVLLRGLQGSSPLTAGLNQALGGSTCRYVSQTRPSVLLRGLQGSSPLTSRLNQTRSHWGGSTGDDGYSRSGLPFIGQSGVRGQVGGIPKEVWKEIQNIKTPFDPYKEFEKIQKMMKPLLDDPRYTLELQILDRCFVSSMSLGALSHIATFVLDMGSNFIALARRGKTLEDFPLVAGELDTIFRCSGEGGVPSYVQGTAFGPRRFQIASGGFGVNAKVISHSQEVCLKLGQAAKAFSGGVVDVLKLLQDIRLAKLRGFVPESCTQEELDRFVQATVEKAVVTTVASPNALNKSIEELIELLRVALEINPRLKALHLKLPINDGLADDLAGFAKVLLTAAMSQEGILDRIKLVIGLEGEGGGTGNTKEHFRNNIVFSNLQGLVDFYTTLGPAGLLPYISASIEGNIYSGDQIAEYLLIPMLAGAHKTPLQFGFGTSALVGAASCHMLRKCHLPRGCAFGTASHHPDDIKNFRGAPSQLFNWLLSMVLERAAKNLRSFGIDNLDKPPPPDEILQRIDNIPIKRAKVLMEIAREGGYASVRREAVLPPSAEIDHSVQNDIIEGVIQGQDLFEIQGSDIGDLFGAKLAGALDCSETPIRVHIKGNVGQWFGAFTTKGMRFILTGDAADSVGRSSNSQLIVNGTVGHRAGEFMRWEGSLSVIAAGNYFGRQAQGAQFSVCQIGSFAFEDARTVDLACIWGVPRHYEDIELDSTLSSHFEFDPHIIGKQFGRGMFSFKGYMPKALYEETKRKGFFDQSVINGYTDNLLETDIRCIFNELRNFVEFTSQPDYLHQLYKKLSRYESAKRNMEIRRLFCKITVGPVFSEI